MNPNTEHKIKEAINNLKNAQPSESAKILQELKPLILSASTDQIVTVLEELDLKPLLNNLPKLLCDDDKKDLVDVFKVVLESLPSSYIMAKFRTEMIEGLKCESDPIRHIWLNALNKSAAQYILPSNLNFPDSWESSVVLLVVELLSTNIETAKYSSEILLKLTKNGSLDALLYSDHFKRKFLEIKQRGEVVELRIYDLMVSIACLSSSFFKKIDETGYLEHLLKTIRSNDPLVTLNCIHLLTNIAMCIHGLEYLKSKGTLNFLSKKILESNQDPLDELTLPGYISVFGAVGLTSPSVLADEHQQILEKIINSFDELSSSNFKLLLSSIETIGIIGQSINGKQILDKQSGMDSVCIPRLGKMLNDACNELQIRSLMSVGYLLSLNQPDPNGVGTSITENWFRSMIPKNRIQTLMKICRQPFKEVRILGLKILQALAGQYWGQKELFLDPTFETYILDRSTEFEKEGKEAKFEIVKVLVTSPFTQTVFNQNQIEKFTKYYNQGPFFVDLEPTVAVEGF